MQKIITKIKKIRLEKGYSHEYIAYELGISQVAYSKVEKLETKLSVERLYKIAEILEVTVSDILDIETNNHFNQTSGENSTDYLQKIENFYQKNKEQSHKIIELYEAPLKDKETLIEKYQVLLEKK